MTGKSTEFFQGINNKKINNNSTIFVIRYSLLSYGVKLLKNKKILGKVIYDDFLKKKELIQRILICDKLFM